MSTQSVRCVTIGWAAQGAYILDSGGAGLRRTLAHTAPQVRLALALAMGLRCQTAQSCATRRLTMIKRKSIQLRRAAPLPAARRVLECAAWVLAFQAVAAVGGGLAYALAVAP